MSQEEDGVLHINGVFQSGLIGCMVLAVAPFSTETPMLKGMSVCVVFAGTGNKVMEGVGGVVLHHSGCIPCC